MASIIHARFTVLSYVLFSLATSEASVARADFTVPYVTQVSVDTPQATHYSEPSIASVLDLNGHPLTIAAYQALPAADVGGQQYCLGTGAAPDCVTNGQTIAWSLSANDGQTWAAPGNLQLPAPPACNAQRVEFCVDGAFIAYTNPIVLATGYNGVIALIAQEISCPAGQTCLGAQSALSTIVGWASNNAGQSFVASTAALDAEIGSFSVDHFLGAASAPQNGTQQRIFDLSWNDDSTGSPNNTVGGLVWASAEVDANGLIHGVQPDVPIAGPNGWNQIPGAHQKFGVPGARLNSANAPFGVVIANTDFVEAMTCNALLQANNVQPLQNAPQLLLNTSTYNGAGWGNILAGWPGHIDVPNCLWPNAGNPNPAIYNNYVNVPRPAFACDDSPNSDNCFMAYTTPTAPNANGVRGTELVIIEVNPYANPPAWNNLKLVPLTDPNQVVQSQIAPSIAVMRIPPQQTANIFVTWRDFGSGDDQSANIMGIEGKSDGAVWGVPKVLIPAGTPGVPFLQDDGNLFNDWGLYEGTTADPVNQVFVASWVDNRVPRTSKIYAAEIFP